MREIKDTFLDTPEETITVEKAHYARLKLGHARYKKALETACDDMTSLQECPLKCGLIDDCEDVGACESVHFMVDVKRCWEKYYLGD